ncbi:DSD1 family PLP-dependent enzyme [Caballeronia sp. LZ033]|uniref:DSD1 family PLP-dependent enzyme n=1 Tax=Caballeronia sp. LZ033 TaxID=3038566 RepID=UPI0028618D07|nr:DSD1 family PLP-dependent enzyme [Caballeronia sp. LZ033]MDR5816558.1 DSD1 family PLP-dependent enzyme [Caballeronia sp. LZ033]
MTLAPPPAARSGDPLTSIATPSLLLDLEAFEANLAAMAAFAAHQGVALRPHAKAHKSSEIAKRQIEASAVGVCCQKLSEAYPFAAAGIRSIHVSNEFVGADKLAMAVELASHVRLSVCVDALPQVQALGRAAAEAGVKIDVLSEVDAGQHRCGVTGEDALLELVDAIAAQHALRFAGIQAYHGGIQHVVDWNARKTAAGHAADIAAGYVRALDARGVRCGVVTGGGTGTVEFDATSGVFTELQPGSYLFMDGDYGGIGWDGALHWRHSLFVLSTVMSATRPGMAVCDVGLKGLAVDSGLPRSAHWLDGRSAPVLNYVAANDEHGMLHAKDHPENDFGALVGERLLLPPGHCDPSVNLYDEYVCYRGGRVVDIWPIDARGLSR